MSVFPQARQLESKEKELASISSFYKQQLEILEKKVRTIFHIIRSWCFFKCSTVSECLHWMKPHIEQTMQLLRQKWQRFGVISYTLPSENKVLVTPDGLLGLEMSGLRVVMVFKCNQWKFPFLLMEQRFSFFFVCFVLARCVLSGIQVVFSEKGKWLSKGAFKKLWPVFLLPAD